jgi:23S rRNA pseudouridine1911/1915/1917 synthase
MESLESGCTGFEQAEQPFRFLVDEKHEGVRLDQFISLQVPTLSRTQVSTAIRNKQLTVDGVAKKSSYRLKTGETVTGVIELEKPLEVVAEKVDFTVLYEDEWLIFITKPPGVVVHPGSGNHSGTLVNGLVHYCSPIAAVGDSIRPGIVHRLDKDTSGVMVVAKTEAVHRALINIFKDHDLHKEYTALVHGVPQNESGRIVSSIGRHHIHRQKMEVKEVGGKFAATNWELVEVYKGCLSRVRLVIETGRTHQIRVHMAHLGHPVAGDTVYGNSREKSKYPRQMLHASRLILNHPVTGRKMDIKAPLWPDIESVLSKLEPLMDGEL